jgi:hypothetical protein
MKTSKMKIYEQPTVKVVRFMVEGGFGPSAGNENPDLDDGTELGDGDGDNVGRIGGEVFKAPNPGRLF